MLASTEKDYLVRLKSLLHQALSETGEVKEKVLEDLQAALREERLYDPQKEKVLLIYEYYSGIRLRANQVNNLRQMAPADRAERKNLITQLIMGSGKSKVILPLLAFLNSHGDNVPVLIVPPQVYATNLEDMRAVSGNLLLQRAETIHLKEGEPLSLDTCKMILEKLNRVKEEKSYLLMSAPQVHKLRLHFIALCKELGEAPEPLSDELINKYQLLKQIMNSLTDAIIDEVDLVLDCLKEVNFSSGEWAPVSEETRGTLLKIFESIQNSKELSDFFKLSHETEAPFDKKYYERTVKPLLADEMMRHAGCASPEIKAYLLADPELQRVPERISQDAALRNPLALGKELLNTLFPLVLQKNSNEHFGLSKEKPSTHAIPYSRSNTPSEGSEFGSPYETLLYTMLYFNRNGLEAAQMRTMIDQYKVEALQQFRSDKIPLQETEGYKKFQKLNLVAGKDLFSIQEDAIEEAVRAFNQDTKKKIHFVHEFAWSKIGSYSERLTSNAQHLVGLFKSVQGFTGTLWNQSTFHPALVPCPDKSVDGKTLNTLDRIEPKVILLESVDALLNRAGEYETLIDEGAWFRGWGGSQVAHELLKRHSHIEGVAFVNDQDDPPGSKGKLVILERGVPPLLQLLSQSKIPLEKRFTYYNVTEAIDIPQNALAKGLSTISKTTTLRGGLQQAPWRMRGLERKQRVDFAAPLELGDVVKNARQAFNLGILNQAKRQEEDKCALKQKIPFQIADPIEQQLRAPETSPQEAALLMRKCRDLFVHKSSREPWDLFGELKQPVPMKQFVEEFIADKVGQFKTIYPHVSSAELENKCRSLIDYDLLPEMALQRKSEEYGHATEVMQELKLEQKTQLQLEISVIKEEESRTFSPSGIPNLTDRFKWDGWVPSLIGFDTQAANEVLSRGAEQLVAVDSTVSLFSPSLQMTRDFVESERGKKSKLFQTGTKPVTLCALQIDEQENKTLVLLHPTEAEFWACLLDLDLKFDDVAVRQQWKEKMEDETYSKELLNVFGEILESIFLGMPFFLEDKEITTDELKERLEKIRSEQGSEAMIEKAQNLFPREFDQAYSKLEESEWSAGFTFPVALRLFGKERKGAVLLISPELGVIKAGKRSVDDATLKKDPQYVALISQAKFYNGVLNNYSKEEQASLHKWVAEKGAENLFALLKNILRMRPEDQQAYEGSVLQKILTAQTNRK